MHEQVTIPTTANSEAKASEPIMEKQADKLPEKKSNLVLQPKLTVGAPDDPYEKEADTVADKVMRMPEQSFVQRKCAACDEEKVQRVVEEDKTLAQAKFQSTASFIQMKCSACEKEEEKISRKPLVSSITPFIQRKSEGESTVSDTLNNSIQNSKGSGSSMDDGTKSFMENRFGVDFSSVNIHTGSESVQMNRELQSQAFTVGRDVYFNESKYRPETGEGKHLLAHELTHVVQQNSGLAKKSIQRYFTFAPDPRPKGTLIHSRVLPMFADNNPDLFTEVKIPGAKKMDVDKGKAGIADFYKPTPSKTIGIRFDNEPSFLTKDTKLQWGGGPYNHNKDSAPQGTTNTPRIRNIDNAPISISLGDLKPGGSAESILGVGQIKDYQDGIDNTSKDINKYLKANPGEGDSKSKHSWSPVTSKISSLTIPPELSYPGGKGLAKGKLAVYSGDGKFPHIPDSGLTGSMYVYKDKDGVWSYEWIPDSIPASTGSGAVNNVLNRLNTDVIPPLISSNSTTLSPKRIYKKQQKNEPISGGKIIQRKEEKFENGQWKKNKYEPWKKDAEGFLADPKEVKKAEVATTLVELKERTHSKVSMPAEVVERGKALDKIKHWKRLGGIYGWLREKFDFIFIKIHAFAKKIKDKVKKFAKTAGNTSFGSWLKAAVKVIFKIFKIIGSWAVGQILDRLVDSLKEGISNNLKKVVEMFTPEGVKSKIEEFEEKKIYYQQLIEEKEDELITRFFGDKLAFFEKMEKLESLVGNISTIVTMVEWGVRLLACAAPPAIGCLWNLVISALQAAFAWLIQTCWFSKKVYGPIISEIDFVRNFPSEVASKIVKSANEYIPMPEGFDPIFAPISVNNSEFKIDCDGSGDGAGNLTPEREAIMKLIEEIGEDKFRAMLEVSLKRGAGPWLLLTVERVSELKEKLKDVSAADLRKVAKDPKAEVPVSLDEFLKGIKKYSKQEQKLIDESRKAKEAKEAKESKAGVGGKSKDGAEADPGQTPIYKDPGKLDDVITGINYACVMRGSKLETGRKYSDTRMIYLGVYFMKNNKSFKLFFNGLETGVQLVAADHVELTNKKGFYGHYDDDNKIIYFEKDKVFKIATEYVLYEDDTE
jgi:hypothetical protein